MRAEQVSKPACMMHLNNVAFFATKLIIGDVHWDTSSQLFEFSSKADFVMHCAVGANAAEHA